MRSTLDQGVSVSHLDNLTHTLYDFLTIDNDSFGPFQAK